MATWEDFQPAPEQQPQDPWAQFQADPQAAAEQPGYGQSLLSAAGRGFASVVPGVVGGVGYLTGSEGLVQRAEDIEQSIAEALPINPDFEDDFAMKAASTVGQVGSILATGGAAGVAGKALQGVRLAGQAARAVPYATGILQGVRGGGQEAEQYGMEGAAAYGRALAGGAIEGLVERLPFGMLTETAAARRLLGEAVTPAGSAVREIASGIGTEATEEGLAQIGGNVATMGLAPAGVETPGLLEGVGEAAALGAVGGAAFGGVNALVRGRPQTIESGEAEIPESLRVAAEAGAFPNVDELESLAGPDATEEVAAAVRQAAEISPTPTYEQGLAPSQPEAGVAPVGIEEAAPLENLPVSEPIVPESRELPVVPVEPAAPAPEAPVELEAAVTPNELETLVPAAEPVSAVETPVAPAPLEETPPPVEAEVTQQPEPTEPNAPEIRQIIEDGQLQYPITDEGGPTAAPGRGNRLVEGGQVAAEGQEVTATPEQQSSLLAVANNTATPEQRPSLTEAERVAEIQQITPTGVVPGDWLSAIFAESAPQTQAVETPEQVPVALADQLDVFAAQMEASAQELASRQYKRGRGQVELRGDGPSRKGSMSFTEINESRRARGLAQFAEQSRRAQELSRAIRNGEVSSNQLRRVAQEARRLATEEMALLARNVGPQTEQPSQRLLEEGFVSKLLLGDPRRTTGQLPGLILDTFPPTGVVPTESLPAGQPTPRGVGTVAGSQRRGGKRQTAAPKTLSEAQARETEALASLGFLGDLRAEREQTQRQEQRAAFIRQNTATPAESVFLRDMILGGWDKALDDVASGRIGAARADQLAQAAFDAGQIDATTRNRFRETINTPQSEVTSPAEPPLPPASMRSEQMARKRRGKAGVPQSVRDQDGAAVDVRVTPAEAARAREIEAKQIPGVAEAWVGTTDEFLSEFGDLPDFDKSTTAVRADGGLEAFYDPKMDRAFVLIDRAQAREGDVRRAVRSGTSTGVETVRRLLRHEAFAHRGWRALPTNLKTEFINLLPGLITPDDIDALVAKGYSRYANWREDPLIYYMAAEEWLATRIERISKLPRAQQGKWTDFMDWLKRVFQWLTGDDTVEPTPKELTDIMRQMVRALEVREAQAPGSEPAGLRSSLNDTDVAYLAAVERGDMETAQRRVGEAVTRRTGLPIKDASEIQIEAARATNDFSKQIEFYKRKLDTELSPEREKAAIAEAESNREKWIEAGLNPDSNDPESFLFAISAGLQPVMSGDDIRRSFEVERNSSIREIEKYGLMGKKFLGQKTETQFKTGSGFVAKMYHATPFGKLTAFDADKLGTLTGAPSATKAHFFAGDPKVSETYFGDDALYLKHKGFLSLTGSQKENLVSAVREEFGDIDSASDQDIEDIALTLFDEIDSYDTTPIDNVLHEVFVSMRNPLVFDFKGSQYREQSFSDLIDSAIENGNDGVVFANTYDAGPASSMDDMGPPTNIFAVIAGNEAQIKSADPVTYDDAGNVIPLSQRFQSESSDIRFSLNDREQRLSDIANSGSGQYQESDALPFMAEAVPGRPVREVEGQTDIARNLSYQETKLDETQAAAIKFVDNLGPVETWFDQLANPAWQQKIDFDPRSIFGQYVLTEAVKRTQNTALVDPAAFTANRQLADYANATSSRLGGGLGARAHIHRDPRYIAMYATQSALDLTRKQQKTVIDPQVNVPQAVEAVQVADQRAREQATTETAEELDLDQIVLDLGMAALDPTLREDIREINNHVLRIGTLQRLRQRLTSGVSQSLAALSAADLEAQYAGLTVEQIDTLLAQEQEALAARVAKVKGAMAGKPKQRVAAADSPVEQARKLIERLEAAPTVKKPGKPNPVRDLYKRHLKDPMTEADFVRELGALGVPAAEASRLYAIAQVKLAAVEVAKQGRQERGVRRRLADLMDPSKDSLLNALNRLRGKVTGDVNWSKIFEAPFERQQQWRVELYRALRADPALANLTPQEARDLAAEVDRIWNLKRQKAFDDQMKRVNLPGVKPEAKKKVQESAPQLLRYINVGTFGDDSFRQAVSKKFGIKALSADEIKRITELAQAAQAEGISTPERSRILDELVKTLQSSRNAEIGEILSNYWVTSVLSGFRTQFDTALAFLNGLRVMSQGIAYSAITKRDFKLAGRSAKDYFKTLADTISEAVAYFVTGDPTLLDGYQYGLQTFFKEGVAASAPYDYFEQVIKSKDARALAKFSAYFMAGVQRAMRAFDHINSVSTTEGWKSLAVTLNPEKYKDARLPTPADVAAAREKAITIVGSDKGFVNRSRVTSATRQILNDVLGQEFPALLDEAREIGLISSYQNDPTGIGGIIYHTLLGVTNKAVQAAGKFRDQGAEQRAASEWSEARKMTDKALRGILYGLAVNSRNITGTRFVRFAGNRFNELLSFLPGAGLLRLYEKDMNESKRAMLITNNLVGSMLGVAMMTTVMRMLSDEEDDEKRGFRVEGAWSNLTPDQKNQLRSQGRSPYTLSFYDGDGKWSNFNYNSWPVAGILAAAGTLNDLRQYAPEKWEAKDMLDRVVSAAWAGVTTFKDLSALSGLMDLLGTSAYATGDPVESAKKWAAKFAANFGGGFIPRAVKDVDAMMNPEIRKPDDMAAYFAKEVPFFRRLEVGGQKLFNIFGEPVQINRQPWSRSYTQTELDDEYRTLGELNSRGLFLGAANPTNRSIGSGPTRRDLTDREAELYMETAGKFYKDYIRSQGERLLRLPNEQAKKAISQDTERLRNAALRRAVSEAKKEGT